MDLGHTDVEADSATNFTQVLRAAARLPWVRIDRAAYLRTALRRYCTDVQIKEAIATSPAAAGVPREVVAKVATTSVRYEAGKVTAISAAAGMPGGLAIVGTVPADVAQYFGHVLRITQKLAYIYSWPDLFGDDEEIDEATEGVLILFIGVMFGVQSAHVAVTKLASQIAAQVLKKLPQQALTKGAIYPLVKKVAGIIGAQMTKKIFAGGVAKIVPIVGGFVSGGVTLATFVPMSRRLEKHLASLELAAPSR